MIIAAVACSGLPDGQSQTCCTTVALPICPCHSGSRHTALAGARRVDEDVAFLHGDGVDGGGRVGSSSHL